MFQKTDDPVAIAKLRAIIAPFADAATRRGFRLLDENFHWSDDPKPGCWGGGSFLYREGVYFDVVAVVVGKKAPRGILPGFNGIQLYSFIEAPQLQMVLTNGSPRVFPESFLAKLIDRLIPPSGAWAGIDCESPADVEAVLAAHYPKLQRGRLLQNDDDPLEQRWRWCDELGLRE